MIQPQRIRDLNQRPIREGRYVLYWMQASQRARFNHALEYAVRGANLQDIPVVVLFVLTEKFPEANLRHYGFMLEGLEEVARNLEERDILFIARCGSPEKDVPDLSGDAAMVVTDRGYLRLQKAWRRRVAEKSPCRARSSRFDAAAVGCGSPAILNRRPHRVARFVLSRRNVESGKIPGPVYRPRVEILSRNA